MPYNISKGVVHRGKRYLDDMLEARKTLTWPTHDAKILSYKIREALFAAQKHPEFEPYHCLKSWFRIRDKKGWVEAEYIGPMGPNSGTHPEGYTQPDVTEVHAVVGACIKFGGLADEILFPNAVLTDDDKKMIFVWGQEMGWKLIDHGEAGVTMTTKDVDPLYLWKPKEGG